MSQEKKKRTKERETEREKKKKESEGESFLLSAFEMSCLDSVLLAATASTAASVWFHTIRNFLFHEEAAGSGAKGHTMHQRRI